MCTTGAKILQPGHEFVLFKNRDFTRKAFDDRIRLDGHVFGALGLETWDGDDPSADRFSGLSIGCNSRLACCSANVRTVPDCESYDLLVEEIVGHCSTVDEAVTHAEHLLARRAFIWGNVLVATPNQVAAFEVRERTVEIVRDKALLVRSNHHVSRGATPDDDDATTSLPRYQSAYEGLLHVQRVEDVFDLLRSHKPDRQHSVCNHGVYDTVYSYVIHWHDGDTDLYVHQGHPCDGQPYVRIAIPWDEPPDFGNYPSAHVA